MPYEDKIMVASGDSEHPGEEEVGFETIPRRGGEGHTYDLEFNETLDELTLTEDSSDKTTLPLAATFVGTTAEWEALSELEKANYRLVNFTEDGGIGDASNAVVAFTSSDVADGSANDWTSVTPITTGLNLKTLWERASMMFKNVRYLFKMLGTTDISSIGNGTVTGAISALKPILLWNNTSGTLSPTTISISNISNYKRIMIGISFVGNRDCIQYHTYKYVNGGSDILAIWVVDNTKTSMPQVVNSCSRKFTFTANGITFEHGYMIYNNTYYPEWDDRCVPHEVYGFIE